MPDISLSERNLNKSDIFQIHNFAKNFNRNRGSFLLLRGSLNSLHFYHPRMP